METMYLVYVLYSSKYDKIYIGCTSDLQQRIISHNHEKNKGWTKSYQPWEVIHSEKFDTKQEALKREKELKSSRGRAYIRKSLLH
ncbi:MAG: GIY-YIG nuclease family protein [Balneolaceae bacterium]